VQHSVAVVQPSKYQATRQCERHFGRQKMADVPDGLDVIVARRDDRTIGDGPAQLRGPW